MIYGDTDSVIVSLDKVIKKYAPMLSKEKKIEFVNQFSQKKIQPVLDAAFEELHQYMNGYDRQIGMKREKIADKMILMHKKKYVLNVWDKEGVRYKEPEIQVTGIEAVRSSTPESCRDALKEAFKIIMNQGEKELQAHIEKFKKEFCALPFDQIAFPRSVNGLDDYLEPGMTWRKGCPIHVRASIVYNRTLQERNISNKYEQIKNGEKIKFASLKMPNPVGENVIACIISLPKEFELEPFIDYDTQFEGAFLAPLRTILETIGWKHESEISLEDFLQ